MTCQIIQHAVTVDGHSCGASRVITVCTTHNMKDTVIVDGFCPLGRIEKKLDQVIELFEEAMAKIEKAMP